jgi:hypothetical protein
MSPSARPAQAVRSRAGSDSEKTMQRTYEIMFIVRPDLADEEVDRLVTTMETNITTAGGTITGI